MMLKNIHDITEPTVLIQLGEKEKDQWDACLKTLSSYNLGGCKADGLTWVE